MNTISNRQAILKETTVDNRIGDSILVFGMGTAIFFWLFSVLLSFIDSPDLGWKLLFIGTELQFYEKLTVSTLFIVFGSHVQANIKKRRRAEDNLQVSEEKYRIILESIEEGYYEIDLDGDFKFVNPSMCKLMARTEKEIIGTNITSYFNIKNSDSIATFFNKIKNNENHPSTIECELNIKGGGRKSLFHCGKNRDRKPQYRCN